MQLSKISIAQRIVIPNRNSKIKITKNIPQNLNFGAKNKKNEKNTAKNFLLALLLLLGGESFAVAESKTKEDPKTENIVFKEDGPDYSTLKTDKSSIINTKKQMELMSQKANEKYDKVSAELINEQTKIKDAAKPLQTQVINDGIKTAKDFEKELKNTLNSYITKWQTDNPGKDFYGMIGASSNIEVEYNGQKFNVSFSDKQIQKIEGKISSTDPATGEYTFCNFKYDCTNGDNNYNYSTVTTQGSDGRCLSSLDVSKNGNSISVTKYAALPDGSGKNIECKFEKSQFSNRNKYYEILFSKDNQILKRIGYNNCITNGLEGSSLITVFVTETLDNKGNIIYNQSKNNPSTGDGNIIIAKLDDNKRVIKSVKGTKSNGNFTEKSIKEFTYFDDTNLYQTEGIIEFYPVENKISFDNAKYVLGITPEGNKMNYIISINRELLDNVHAYNYTVIDDYLYTNLSIENIETYNDKNEIIGTKRNKRTEINASDKIGQHITTTTSDTETKLVINKEGEKTTKITNLENIQKLDGKIDDLQQREIDDCALHIILSLLCKNENMNFCNNNIGEIELANGIKIPISTITKRDDGSVIVSMYNDKGKLCRQIVTKEELEKPTYKVPGEEREIVLSEGDRDIKAIEIGALKIYGWKIDEKTGMKTPAFASESMEKLIMRLTGNRYFKSENIDIFNPKNIGRRFCFITYAKAGSSNGDMDTYDIIDKDGVMRTLNYFHAYEAVMNPDGTITLINPHNGRDFCFTFTAQELNKFPGYYSFYAQAAPELEKFYKKK